MDFARLPAHLSELGRVCDGLRSGVHIALTARCEAHSRLFPRLDETRGPCPKWQEQEEAPETVRVDLDQEHRQDYTDDEEHDAKSLTLSALPGSDIRDAHSRCLVRGRCSRLLSHWRKSTPCHHAGTAPHLSHLSLEQKIGSAYDGCGRARIDSSGQRV